MTLAYIRVYGTADAQSASLPDKLIDLHMKAHKQMNARCYRRVLFWKDEKKISSNKRMHCTQANIHICVCESCVLRIYAKSF